MTLDLTAVGHETEAMTFPYDFRSTVLYALGVGAKAEELDYLYEKRGPLVVPSFAVVPTYPALEPLVQRANADMSKVVHGSQLIRLKRPIPSAGVLSTKAKIEGIYDLKRLSQVVFSTQTTSNGELIFETEWSLIVRDTGGFGGPRPPKTSAPKATAENLVTFDVTEETSKEQALLYRLSGDLNPLHADPEFARDVGFAEGPILHGLCTFGYIARACVAQAAAGDPSRIEELFVPFKKPVWPGDSLRTVGQKASLDGDDSYVLLSTYAGGRPEAVVSGGWAKVRAQ